MLPASQPGRIVILNGAPRSGKTSLARAVQERSEELWMAIGVDAFADIIPKRLSPGIGLRPGGERPELEPVLPPLYAALYGSAVTMSRQGLNVVVDVGHHEGHSGPLGILSECARMLVGLPTLFVGVRCPLPEILRRRSEGAGDYVRATESDPLPEPIRRWQEAVHRPGIYDLEIDTSNVTPSEGALIIIRRLEEGPPGRACEQLAQLAVASD